MLRLRLRLANMREEIASLELVARGVTTKEMKKGEMPEVSENPLIAPTSGSAKKAATAPPAIKKRIACPMMRDTEGFCSLSSSSTSSTLSSNKATKSDCAVCNVHESICVKD